MTDSQDTPIAADGDQRPHRRIKSFVMRAGRMTEGQQRGLDQGGPLYILPLADSPVDYDQVFGRCAPRTLEIGFGMGHSLLEMAAAAPEQDFIGVEVHRPGVGALLNGVLTQGLKNLRVYDCDAIEVLNRCVADNSLDRLMLFFPDPWHKARHHKRRIVQLEFAELVRRKLKPGGVFHMATDWEPYAEYMLDVMSAAPGYRNRAADGTYVPRPEERPITKIDEPAVLGAPGATQSPAPCACTTTTGRTCPKVTYVQQQHWQQATFPAQTRRPDDHGQPRAQRP